MKRSLLALTPLVALVLSTGAYAQGGRFIGLDDNRKQTLDVDFSGEIDLNWAYQDATLREAAGDGSAAGSWVIGGQAAGSRSRESADFFWGRLTLRLHATIADNVKAMIALQTENIDDGTITPFGSTDGTGATEDSAHTPKVREMYVDVNQLWSDHISLRLGMQTVKLDMRGTDRSGGAPFVDLTEAESAFNGVQTAGPVTYRDRMSPVGFFFRYEDIVESNIDFKWYLMPTVGGEDFGGDSPSKDEQLYLANLDWYLPDIGENSKLNVLVAWNLGGDAGTLSASPVNGLSGTGRDADVLTFGLGIDVRGIGDPGLELYGEVYVQTGSAGRSAVGASKLDARGLMFDLGFRYEALDTRGHPWFEIGYIFVRGDDAVGAADGEYEGFISYENNDDFAIIEGNELGLDIDTGYSGFKVKGGLRFSSEHMQDNIHLDVKAGFFQFDESQPLAGAPAATGAEDDLGVEVDLKLTYHFNDQLSFSWLIGFLVGADGLEPFTVNTDDDTWVTNLGMNLRF